MSEYDIAVAYRIYPVVAKPAIGLPFSDNKLLLSEICLRSFKESLGSLRAKIWVLLDRCPDDYAQMFSRYFSSEDLVLVRLPGIGNHATFGKQIDILLDQTDCDLVYFAEDDYVYLPGQFSKMIEFITSHNDVHFVSPYDHPDCYALEIHDAPGWIRVSARHHWKTAASTCLTFLTEKKVLRRTQATFRSYCHRNYDFSLWLALTKQSIFNPFQTMRFLYRQPLFAKVIVKAWLYGWSQILFGERMNLWTPVPGIATHLDIQGLSPLLNWTAVINRYAENVTGEKRDSKERDTPPTASVKFRESTRSCN